MYHFNAYLLLYFLLMTYKLLILYFFYTIEMLGQKKTPKNKNWVASLFGFKMGYKALEKTFNNNKFFSGVSNKQTAPYGFNTFLPKGRTMEMKLRRWTSGHQKLSDIRTSEAVSDPLRVITMADLTTTQDIARELSVGYSIVIRHLKQTGKVWK